MTRSVEINKGDHDDLRSDYRSSRRRTSWGFDDYNDMSFSVLYDSGITLKKRLVSVTYNFASSGHSYNSIEQALPGSEKVRQDHGSKHEDSYISDNVAPSYPFQTNTLESLGQISARLKQHMRKLSHRARSTKQGENCGCIYENMSFGSEYCLA